MNNRAYEIASKNFKKKNRAYLVCSGIYFLFAVWWFGGFNIFKSIEAWKYLKLSDLFLTMAIWGILALVYILSLAIATARGGEMIMRFFNNIRQLETSQEKEYLRPIFNEVLSKAKEQNPEIDVFNINIHIIDSMTVNACAVGLKTVAVTKGAVQAFTADELKAVITHEIAHILYGDTFAKIFLLIGNGIFTVCFFLVKLIWWLIGRIPAMRQPMQASSIFLDMMIFAFMFPMLIVLAISDRGAEQRADFYAYKLGYGEEMVSALYKLEKISLRGIEGIIEKMLASHPRVTSRIEALEVQLGIQVDER